MEELPDDAKRLIARHALTNPLRPVTMCLAEVDYKYCYPEFVPNFPIGNTILYGTEYRPGFLAIAYDKLDSLPCKGNLDEEDETDDQRRDKDECGFNVVKDKSGTRLCIYSNFRSSYHAVSFGRVVEKRHRMSALAITCKFFLDATPSVTTNCIVPKKQWTETIYSGEKGCEDSWKIIVIDTDDVGRVESKYNRRLKKYFKNEGL